MGVGPAAARRQQGTPTLNRSSNAAGKAGKARGGRWGQGAAGVPTVIKSMSHNTVHNSKINNTTRHNNQQQQP